MQRSYPLPATSIYEKIWEHSPSFKKPDSYAILQDLTQKLIKNYAEAGRLEENPFHPTTKRTLHLPFEEINSLLTNSTCLITGGLGCVGMRLLNKLSAFDIRRIIVLDKQPLPAEPLLLHKDIIYVEADILDEKGLNDIFRQYQPQFVFHTAAQRNPGYAEQHIEDTVNINIFGTLNVVNACEKCASVLQCVFSSTGKASRYYTDEVYAATKKVCEYIFDTYAYCSDVLYSFVRFTHILDNSLMHTELRDLTHAEYLPVHSPGKYVTAQNVDEAACLLINSLLTASHGVCNFSIVRHLEWPVESLEVALYYIKIGNSNIPVIFKGNPPGYAEKFFRGQMDWNHPQEMNLLINVYEHKHSVYNEAGDTIISRIVPTCPCVLQEGLEQIRNAQGKEEVKSCLSRELKNMVQSALQHVDKQDTLNILQWGLQPQFLAAEGTTMTDYGATVLLLMESLEDSSIPQKKSYSTSYE